MSVFHTSDMLKRRIFPLLTLCRKASDHLYEIQQGHINALVVSSQQLFYQQSQLCQPLRMRRRTLHSSPAQWAVEEVKAPIFPDSVSSGDAKVLKKEGDAVAMDEVVLEIETDKTAIPVMSPGHGKITKIYVKSGDKITSNKPLFQVDVTGVAPAAATAPAAQAAPAPVAAAPAYQAAPGPPPPIRMAPKAGNAKAFVNKPTPLAMALGDMSRFKVGKRCEYSVKMSPKRKQDYEKMRISQKITSSLTTFNDCDLGNLIEFLNKYEKPFMSKHGVKLTLLSPFVLAAVGALKAQPIVNGVIKGDYVVYRNYIDLVLSLPTPRGVVAPILRHAESKNYADVERELCRMSKMAKCGILSSKELEGGTFTICNVGTCGTLMSTPVIRQPQSAILGVHKITSRPVAIDEKVVIRPMMYISLTYDHRLVDGREAVYFLRKVKAGVENPTSILAGVM